MLVFFKILNVFTQISKLNKVQEKREHLHWVFSPQLLAQSRTVELPFPQHLEERASVCPSLNPYRLLERCSSKTSAKGTLGPPSCVVWLLLYLAICYRDAELNDWSIDDVLFKYIENDISWYRLSGNTFDWFFIHCAMIGWRGPISQFFLLVESFICLFRWEVLHFLQCVGTTVVFITGFLISFFSFQDRVTLYVFSCDPDSFLLSETVLSFSMLL